MEQLNGIIETAVGEVQENEELQKEIYRDLKGLGRQLIQENPELAKNLTGGALVFLGGGIAFAGLQVLFA